MSVEKAKEAVQCDVKDGTSWCKLLDFIAITPGLCFPVFINIRDIFLKAKSCNENFTILLKETQWASLD